MKLARRRFLQFSGVHRWVVEASSRLLMSERKVEAETVSFAHQTAFAPFADVQDGKSVGLMVDLIREAAAREGIDAQFVPVPFEQVQETLQDGRADAIFPLAITPARRQTFDFSDPFVTTGGAIYVRAPNPSPESLAALSGKIVMTPRTGPLVAILQATAPDIRLVTTATYEETLARLVNGEADAAALNFHVGALLAAKLYPGKVTASRFVFAEAPNAVGVLKGRNAALLTRLDAGLAAIKADGAWRQINKRWIGQ